MIRGVSREEGGAEFIECGLSFPRHDIAGVLGDGGQISCTNDLGSAEDDGEIGAELTHYPRYLFKGVLIPDIDPQSDDGGIPGEDRLGHIHWPLIDGEFNNFSGGREFAQVGLEIAQTEGGVDVARVSGG